MAKFKVGDRVKDKHGNRGIVVGIQDDDAGPFGPPPSKYGAILRIKTDDGKTGYLEEANASLANSRACNSTNPIVRKAMNADDAQGHEHGSDGKFTSKGGGGRKDSEDFHSHIDSLSAKAASGEDGYEDPKTKRMRERLAKMREKTEALRKDNERRRAALVSKRAELDKMRADIMKANVDRWKAGVSASKNAVVAKAMNAVARNAKNIDSEISRVERELKRSLTDEEFWALGDYCMKNLDRGPIPTKELLSVVKKATNTRTLPVSQLRWTKCEKQGIEAMKKYLEKSGGVLPKMSDEISRVLGVVPDIDTTEKQNVMSYFKYGDGKKFVRNAVARNYKPTSEFEVGDTVRFKDSVRSVPHDETYKVVKVEGIRITVRGGRDGSTSIEFSNNLEIV